MGRAIKLVLYYFAYQLAFTFLVGLPAEIIKVMNEISEMIIWLMPQVRIQPL